MAGTLEFELGESNAASGTLRGYGDLVVLSLPSVAVARKLGRAVSMASRGPGSGLARAFRRADLSVDVRVRGVSVARVGPDASGGPLSRLASDRLGVDASLSLGGLFRSFLR